MNIKKILLVVLISFATGCSKDDMGNPVNVQFDFDSIGSVEEQTPEEAKKTINGKWDVNVSPSSSKGSISCNFYGIEFTDDRFALRFDIQGIDPDSGENIDEAIYAYGPYDLIENSDGLVTAVELYETVQGVDYKIARLTDIVVEETANELNANFIVEFDLPDDIAEDFPCGNLSGDYSADKDDPVVSEEAGSGNTNFAKLVNVWRMTGLSIDGDDEDIALFVAEDFASEDLCGELFSQLYDTSDLSIQAEAIFQEAEDLAFENNTSFQDQINALVIPGETATTEQIDDYNNQLNAITQNADAANQAIFENANQLVTALYDSWVEPTDSEIDAVQEECESRARQYAQTIDAAIEVAFSAYGSYIFSISIDGETVEVEVDDWRFTDANQNKIFIDNETTLIIDQITDTQLRLIENVNEIDEESGESDEFQVVYSFSIVN